VELPQYPPHSEWTGAVYALRYNTLAGAIEGMRGAPCGDFNQVRVTGRIGTFYVLEPPKITVRDLRVSYYHTYGGVENHYFGEYDARINAACEGSVRCRVSVNSSR